MNLSPHFSLAELVASQSAARLGIDNTPPADVVERLKKTALMLEGVRTLLGVPIIISSGYRCPALNKAVGGAASSQHLLGEAVDFIAPGFGSPDTVISRLVDSGIVFDQCISEFTGNGGGWVHLSFRANPRRQALRIDAKGTRPWAS